MRNMHRVTYALAALVLVTLVFSVAKTRSRTISTAGSQQPPKSAAQRNEESKRAFPVADYDEPEPSDPVKRAERKEKQKRHNTFSEVMKKPHPEDAEIVIFVENAFEFPALPVDKSDVIVVGDVVAGEAHMSENKKNVFSEFTFHITKVHKSPTESLPLAGTIITVERPGGFVRYPNGQTVLYRWAKFGMPRVGGRYVLFLNLIPKSDAYTILTGYELGEQVISPLDSSRQFEALKGINTNAFEKRLLDSLSESAAGRNNGPRS